jgi:DNA-binding GntR family transcriptional regulator
MSCLMRKGETTMAGHNFSPQGSRAPFSAEAIYETVRQDIVRMRLRPGERLTESDLGLRFGTSRTPVREAIVRLVNDGLIDVLPQRGTFVAPISLSAVRRARFVRSALELAVIREAAEQGLPRAAFREAKSAIAAQESAGRNADLFTKADDRFHRVFADAIGFGDIWSVVESQKAQFDRIRFLSLPETTSVHLLIKQHREILDAVEAGDPDTAERILRMHLSIVVETAIALMQTHPSLIYDDLDRLHTRL